VLLNCCVKVKAHDWVGVQLEAVPVGKPVEQDQPRDDASPRVTVQPAVAVVAVVAALQTGDYALPT
jgi:hypothetical protein